MARFRRRGRFRPYSKRRRVFGRGSLRRRVRRTEKKIRRINSSIETKKYDTYGAWANETNALAVNIAPLVTGTGSGNRVGLQVKATSITLRLWFEGQNGTFANDIFNNFRIMIVREKHAASAGTAPAISDILQTSADTGGTIPAALYPVLAQYNWPYRDRYRIMFDKTFTISSFATADTALTAQNWDPSGSYVRHYKKLKIPCGFLMDYTGGTSAITKNALWLYFVGDDLVDTSSTVYYSVRIKYKDA